MYPLPVSCHTPNDAFGKVTTNHSFLGLIGAEPYPLKQIFGVPQNVRIYQVSSLRLGRHVSLIPLQKNDSRLRYSG